ncbi:ubiquitin carboxyl-terminal hydrolase 14-like isoform 2, partial [Aphelenchoides avenae]
PRLQPSGPHVARRVVPHAAPPRLRPRRGRTHRPVRGLQLQRRPPAVLVLQRRGARSPRGRRGRRQLPVSLLLALVHLLRGLPRGDPLGDLRLHGGAREHLHPALPRQGAEGRKRVRRLPPRDARGRRLGHRAGNVRLRDAHADSGGLLPRGSLARPPAALQARRRRQAASVREWAPSPDQRTVFVHNDGNVHFSPVVCIPAKQLYEIRAVVNHGGKMTNEGHYVAYLRMKNEKWLLCDDRHVTAMNSAHALRDCADDGYLYLYAQ